jgi:sirohydrochlorin ferrochelatase
VQGRRPHGPDVARLLLESIGADPAVVDLVMDDAAIRLWRAVTAWDEFLHLFELQHPKTPADQDHITTTIRLYLEARDWVSFDRGEVVDFGDKDPQRERTEAFK